MRPCIDNTDREASLIPRKIHGVIPGPRVEKDDFIRVIDESGEDHLYHIGHFVWIRLSAEAEKALIAAQIIFRF